METRERVVAQWAAGISTAEIARELGIPQRTVRRLIALKRATGTVARRSSKGRWSRMAPETIAVLKRLRDEDPTATLQQLADRLFEQTGVRVSSPTVGTRLKELGVSYMRASAKAQRPRGAAEERKRPPTRPYRPGGAGPTSYAGRRAYPSDLTDAQWGLIAPLVPACKPGGRHEEIPRRELVNAMLYLLHTGCPWRAMPHDLPHWSTVYYYFKRWRQSGLWAQVLAVLFEQTRRMAGRSALPTAASLDAQSVKTTEKGGHAGLTASSA
jgi:transposase